MEPLEGFEWVQEYLYLPWEKYATGPHSYDCFGVVYKGLGHLGCLPDRHLEVDGDDWALFHNTVLAEQESGNWRQLQEPVPGAVVLMSKARMFHHVGLWVPHNGGCVLHSRRGAGVVLENIHRLQLQGMKKFEYWLPVR